jgi:hypothetical protein
MAEGADFEGYDAQDIGEPLSVLFVVAEPHLYFLVRADCLGHLLDGGGALNMSMRDGARTCITRALQEAAVSAQDLITGISRQLIETIRGVDNGRVWEFKIAEGEGDGAVNRPEVDDWMRAASNLELLGC